MNFKAFQAAVNRQFKRMMAHPLFVVDVERDEAYATYLSSFPEGTNPLFRERTEHDCSCCKSFIRNVGHVIAVIDGKRETIWDVVIEGEPAYQQVADALAELVRGRNIKDVFLADTARFGAERTFEETVDSRAKEWNHFFVNLDAKFVTDSVAAAKGHARTTQEVFTRAIREIKASAIEEVLDLISQNTLYRGAEFKHIVVSFKKEFEAAHKLKTPQEREIFAWTRSAAVDENVARIRNVSIGTLLTDLSEGIELERAVASFESKVAPTNYRRTTALVTPAMIKKAKEKIEELGLTSSLHRRYAHLDDLTINELIFADRSIKKKLGVDVFEELGSATTARRYAKSEEVSIEEFIKNILPRAKTVEVLLENKHRNHMVSLVAPTDATARPLFKWGNQFSWSYAGEVTDSIKERVKAAGGNVTGELCCRLSWFNHDDLDLHMYEPNGYEIYYGNRNRISPAGGRLDVDMNAGCGTTREPVENIFYERLSTMREGEYRLIVNQFCKRETSDVGFEVQIEFNGETINYAYPKAVPNHSNIEVARLRYTKANGIEIISALEGTAGPAKQVWGLTTNQFQRVNGIMYSPNHWEGEGVGNKHLFFMLDGCVNEDTARGFYNEFLNDKLTEHRKVMELVGSKTRLEADDKQLSGIGISLTQRHQLVVRVTGAVERVVKVNF